LKPLVDAGTFREDLFYRLEVITIVLPPLRDRIEDIPLLSRYFVDKFGRTKERPVTGLSPDTIPLLTRYAWPGNVRELEHVIERAIALTPYPIITPEDLPETIRAAPVHNQARARGWETLHDVEKNYILRVLEAHHQDQGETADILGIHRKTLFRKLRQYGKA
jgi:transcriptional regulator with PAS, ATPase and Fis domain